LTAENIKQLVNPGVLLMESLATNLAADDRAAAGLYLLEQRTLEATFPTSVTCETKWRILPMASGVFHAG